MSELLAHRFRVIASLGQGAMGAVHHVADTLAGDTEMALKVIQVPGEITPDLRLRFKEEFRAMARLKHPNTVEVFDYGLIDAHTRFITMALVPGRDLADFATGGQLALPEAYSLLVQLLQALGFIHDRLYVHRDIKLANCRVTPEGTLKLIDYGLMAQLGLPTNGKLAGTPGTMPPEVLQGGVINASSDLYSFGCLAYELLTGQPPFSGKVIEVVRAHCQTPAPSLRALRPDAPEALDAIVRKLMAKDPRARYQQAAEVIDDLGALAGLAVTRDNMAQKTSYLISSALIGRHDELAQLESVLAQLRSEGRGGACFVVATAGVGKSRLVQELLLQAKIDEVPVCQVVCLEKVVTPYKFLARALKPLMALATDMELSTHGPVLASLFPELARAGQTPATPLDPDREKVLAHDALVALLREVGTRTPLVVFFDDLHWADPRSLEALNHCIRALADGPVLFLATMRGDEIAPGHAAWQTINEGVTTVLPLRPFEREHVTALVEAMLHTVEIEDGFAAALFDATSGNAFFVTEVLRYLIERGDLVRREGVWEFPSHGAALMLPHSVEETIVRRLARLHPEARALACVASVLGRYLNRDMLREVGGLDDETLFARLDELVASQFVLKDGHRYTFPHDRVREALYAALPETERRRLHLRCGEYLEGLPGARKEASLNKLAHHFGLGSDPAKAYHYLRLAGSRARAAGMALLALRKWQKAADALDQLPDADQAEAHALWWDIGSLGFNVLPELAIETLERLTAAWASAGQDGSRPLTPGSQEALRARALLATAYGFAGQPARGLILSEGTLASLTGDEGPAYAALLMSRCSNLFHAGRFDELVAVARRAEALLSPLDLSEQPTYVQLARLGAASFQNAVAYQGQRPDDFLRDQALLLAARYGTPHVVNNVTHYHGVWAAWRGDREQVDLFVDEAVAHSRKLLDGFVLYLRPMLCHQHGEFEEAQALIALALRMPSLGQVDLARHLLLSLSALNRLALGDASTAEQELSELEAHARTTGMALILMHALIGRGRVALHLGDAPGARTCLSEALTVATAGPTRNPLHEATASRYLGETALAERQFSEALSWVTRAHAIVTSAACDIPLEAAWCHELMGRVYLEDVRREAAAGAFKQAGELFHGLKNRHGLYGITLQLARLSEVDEAPSGDLSAEQRWLMLKAMAI